MNQWFTNNLVIDVRQNYQRFCKNVCAQFNVPTSNEIIVFSAIFDIITAYNIGKFPKVWYQTYDKRACIMQYVSR